jgi:hypothetical protein
MYFSGQLNNNNIFFSYFSQDWKIFNGNEIGALIGWWQFKLHTELLSKEVSRKNLHFIASTVSSKMLQSISNVEGVSFEVSYKNVFNPVLLDAL